VGRPNTVGLTPTEDQLNLEGVDISREDLDRILTIDVHRWRQELDHRREHLSKFEGLPEEIWEAHRRIADELG
jgi:phosphoenolpyruvate carboxykinase (GTP)